MATPFARVFRITLARRQLVDQNVQLAQIVLLIKHVLIKNASTHAQELVDKTLAVM